MGGVIHGMALCAGGGGLEAGLHLVLPGYRLICAVERQAYAAACLVEWMEQAGMGACPVWDDVTTFDAAPWRGCVDILTAGYPCQPYSKAGRRRGESDSRNLWPHIYEHIRELMPPICFFENVPRHATCGFPSVRADLERLGYRVEAGLFSASQCGAPHARERLFFVGALGAGPQVLTMGDTHRPGPQAGQGEGGATAYADPRGLWPARRGEPQPPWEAARVESEPCLGGAAYGLGDRAERLHLLGNGVVPVVAALAFVTLWQRLCPINTKG